MEQKQLPKIALGAWAWGNDGTFGNALTSEELRPVFEAGMKAGLNLWDTAYAYGMGTSEKVLGKFLRDTPREDVIISDKFTPQCADPETDNGCHRALRHQRTKISASAIWTSTGSTIRWMRQNGPPS